MPKLRITLRQQQQAEETLRRNRDYLFRRYLGIGAGRRSRAVLWYLDVEGDEAVLSSHDGFFTVRMPARVLRYPDGLKRRGF